METLGLTFDGRQRVLRHTAARVWRFSLATHALLRRTTLCHFELEVWIGHAVHVLGLPPPLFSALQRCYSFLGEMHTRRRAVPAEVRAEMWIAAALCSVIEVPLYIARSHKSCSKST